MALKFKGIFHKPTKCKDGFYVKLVRVSSYDYPYIKVVAVDNYGNQLRAGNLIAIDPDGIYINMAVNSEIDLPRKDYNRIKVRK